MMRAIKISTRFFSVTKNLLSGQHEDKDNVSSGPCLHSPSGTILVHVHYKDPMLAQVVHCVAPVPREPPPAPLSSLSARLLRWRREGGSGGHADLVKRDGAR